MVDKEASLPGACPITINNQPVHLVNEAILDQPAAPVLETGSHAKATNAIHTNATVGNASREPITPTKVAGSSNTFAYEPELEVLDSDKVPKVGLCFQSEEEAYTFYNSYAKDKGFSIRKCHKKVRSDKTLSSKYFVCSKEGVKAKHPTHETVKEQATTRVNCTARVQFNISREGIWNIQKVELSHNHHLVTPDKSHMLRSQRKLLDADCHIIKQMHTSGIRPFEIYNFYEQWYGDAENVPFLDMDSNNYIRGEREKYLESKDAQTLLEYLKKKQAKDPSFFYAVQLDKEDGRIANFFWADGQAIIDYSIFGDVVSFDTTFQTNKFEMPFAPILGVNHHKQTIIFGATLLHDEKQVSFEWLFSTFLEAMSGKQPETIFTDQCVQMINAIGKLFPNTKHRLCLWHLYQNAAKHLSHVIGNHPEFLKSFKRCVYEDRSVPHFENRWHELLVNYSLEGNSWMANLYKLREKWATVYRRDSFSGDMTTTQRSEGMNNVFKKTFRKKLSISEFIEAHDKCMARLRRKEKYEDFKSRHTNPVPCIPDLPLLKSAAESYTRTLYSDFEEEFKAQFNMSCFLLSSDGANNTYMVKSLRYKTDEAIVSVNSTSMDISCSCRLYGCVGILCRHAHKVLMHCNIVDLPSQYIMKRWTKYVKHDIFKSKPPTGNDNLETLFAHTSRKMKSLALKSKPSKEILQHVNIGIDKLASEVDDLLSKLSLEENEDPECYTDFTEDVSETHVTFKAPIRKKGPMKKRSKGALEGPKKGKNAGTSKKVGGASQGTDESVVHPVEHLQFESQATNDCAYNINSVSAETMSFSAYPAMFVQPIQGEFTRLLLQGHEESTMLPPVRRLDFNEETSTSIFDV